MRSLIVDLLLIAPAVDQVRRFVERGIDRWVASAARRGCAHCAASAEIDRHMARAVELARLAAGQRNDLDAGIACEMPQGGVADQTRRARDHDLLACHATPGRPAAS
jgi:hypothetical protein